MNEILQKYDLNIIVTQDGFSVISWDELKMKLEETHYMELKRLVNEQTYPDGVPVNDVERFLYDFPVID